MGEKGGMGAAAAGRFRGWGWRVAGGAVGNMAGPRPGLALWSRSSYRVIGLTGARRQD